ncbi:hypothetical protein CVT24_007280 [Panaeolus cyanescens]|uniref:Zn(2)-C6 fungal-type domain-containing protein n=1 Tax=Panaeolus cyanescens TaxID=181874 RepID=A0A409VJ17_9AGAR|nr:hypothetical protein CVT24_007280 [Panaeolus cyanescens]
MYSNSAHRQHPSPHSHQNPPPSPASYRPQPYYLNSDSHSQISVVQQVNDSRSYAEDHSYQDFYAQPDHNGQPLFHNMRQNTAIPYTSRESISPVVGYTQSYDRRPPTSSAIHDPSFDYYDQHPLPNPGSTPQPPLVNSAPPIQRSTSQALSDGYNSFPPEHSNTYHSRHSVFSGPSSEHSGESEYGASVPPEAQTLPKPRKPRREKPRIELAPDQPFTTQGKPRARVYVACIQCRTRKIRCDGAKPVCHNCGRRTNGNNECTYDPVPKRRGPDRTPGARQRMARDARNDDDDSTPQNSRRRRRTRDSLPSDQVEADERQFSTRDSASGDSVQISRSLSTDTGSLSLSAPSQNNSFANSVDGYVPMLNYERHSYSSCGCHHLVHCPAANLALGDPVAGTETLPLIQTAHDMKSMIPPFAGSSSRGYITELDENGNEIEKPTSFDIGGQPSLSFTRKIWWDSLLSLYLSATNLQPIVSSSQREIAAQNVISDLRFLFRSSNYWFSFFHLPTFFGNFYDPIRRENMQPSLVLALLAISTFWQSSEVGYGRRGRERALRLRDEAQAALDASFNAGWVDETLAQAAWLLALFEVCAHPRHSSERSTSSMVMLDSLIRSLSLTLVDADDPNTNMFPPGSVPVVGLTSREPWVPEQSPVRISSVHAFSHQSPLAPTYERNCSCHTFTLKEHWPSADEHAPLWGPTPAWDDTWTPGEIRKESCRRLCWSAMILAAGHISYTSSHRSQSLDLFISDPANYALLFSGESLARSPALAGPSKDSIWALHDRSFLLWHGCMRMRNDPTITDQQKAEFAVKAWLEADSLEENLNRHTCLIERAFIFQAREYIFNTRMCVSYEFRRYIPLATANVHGLFHRNKAEEWLTHQSTVAQRFMQGLHTITGNSNNLLARRPFFVFWFMGQIHRALNLWFVDNSLTIALDVCKALIPAIDYLTVLWPCAEQRSRYTSLRAKVSEACIMAMVEPPAPLTLAASLSHGSLV